MSGCETFLFVYGTLRHDFPGRMAAWLRSKGRYEGRGVCRGRLFDLGPYPVMVASAREGEVVCGDVYRLEQPQRWLAQLDRYEGCGRSARPPGEYRRTRIGVTLDDGREVEAWAYLYRYPTRGLKPIPGGDYLSCR